MKKGFVYLVGAGPGDPELITVKALRALEEADVIVYDFLANSILLDKYSCEKIYVGKSGSNHTLTQDEINQLIIDKALEGKTVTRLKGGDPFIFGRGGEEAEELVDAGIAFAVVPGISSFYSAPAYAGIPVTHRDHANALEVITGHRRADGSDDDDVNFPEYDSDRTYAFLMGMKNLGHITASLIETKNFPPDTPVGIITWGTRPQQRVATGTLKTIVKEVEKAGLTPPAIILVGTVVTLREKLRWFDNMPLFGKRIVVTRTRKQASKISQKLMRLGAEVIEFPTIEIVPEKDMSGLVRALDKADAYDWLVLTSQNAVEIFFDELLKSGQDVRALGNLKVAVIGPATGNELINYGLIPDIVPEKYVAEGLLAAFDDCDLKNKKILLPCSAEARPVLAEGLAARGAEVDRIHIYGTALPEGKTEEEIEMVGNADYITFASSSTVSNFFKIIPDVKAKIASIGPVTSAKVKELGFDVAIEAEEYTIDGIVEAVIADCVKPL